MNETFVAYTSGEALFWSQPRRSPQQALALGYKVVILMGWTWGGLGRGLLTRLDLLPSSQVEHLFYPPSGEIQRPLWELYQYLRDRGMPVEPLTQWRTAGSLTQWTRDRVPWTALEALGRAGEEG